MRSDVTRTSPHASAPGNRALPSAPGSAAATETPAASQATTIIPGNALDIRCLLRTALHGCRSVGATFRAAGLPGWWTVPFLADPGVELPGLVQTVGLPDPEKPVHRDPDLD